MFIRCTELDLNKSIDNNFSVEFKFRVNILFTNIIIKNIKV